MSFDGINPEETRANEPAKADSLKVDANHNRNVRHSAVVYSSAHVSHELRGNSMDTLEEQARDKERIACLEAIIAVLIEKNENIRQQLMQSMN